MGKKAQTSIQNASLLFPPNLLLGEICLVSFHCGNKTEHCSLWIMNVKPTWMHLEDHVWPPEVGPMNHKLHLIKSKVTGYKSLAIFRGKILVIAHLQNHTLVSLSLISAILLTTICPPLLWIWSSLSAFSIPCTSLQLQKRLTVDWLSSKITSCKSTSFKLFFWLSTVSNPLEVWRN